MKNYDDAHEKNLSNYICYLGAKYPGLDSYEFLTYDPVPEDLVTEDVPYCENKAAFVDRENMIEMFDKGLLVYDQFMKRLYTPICLEDLGKYSRLTMITSVGSPDLCIYSSEAIDVFLEKQDSPS